MKNSNTENELHQKDILRDEMMLLRLRLDIINDTPIVVKLLIDLALKIENNSNEYDLDIQDYLDATELVHKWIDDHESMLSSAVH